MKTLLYIMLIYEKVIPNIYWASLTCHILIFIDYYIVETLEIWYNLNI